MAVTVPTLYPSYLQSKTTVTVPKASLSGVYKAYEGLRIQPLYSYGVSTPIDAYFYKKAFTSIEAGFRTRNSVPRRLQIKMMPVPQLKVLYKNPGENRSQWIDIWNALYRERIIFIGKYIDDDFSNQTLATMLYLDTVDDSSKLYIYIASDGGDVSPSMALYDTMQSLNSPVATHCMGYAANLASFILAAGDKGSRSAMPMSVIQFEAPAATAHGKADDIRVESEELTRIKNYLYKELAEKTGHPVEKIHQDFRGMNFFGADDALEYGIIDRIYRPDREKKMDKNKFSPLGIGAAQPEEKEVRE